MLGLLRPTRLIALALIGGGIFGWVYWKRIHRTSEVSQSAAVEDFRRAKGAGRSGGQIPQPGVYTYRQSGSERGSFGPLGIDRVLPREAQLTIRPMEGGYLSQLDLAREHIEARRFRLTSEGTRVTWIRTKIEFATFGRDDRRTTKPQPLETPTTLTVGRIWTARYRAGDLPVAAVSRVLRKETVSIDGASVDTFVIETRSVTGGSHPGTETDTTWWSPRYLLPMRLKLQRKIRGAAGFRVDAELSLTSVRPAR